ncbi:MAG: EAL domain-containing protein [Christensenellales bacterium]|jgi:diguanylate cyclase (GGDEF)-like protein
MKHDLILSIIYYLCGCFYMFFGIYTLHINSKSHINQRFLLLTLSMAAWSFAYSFSYSEPTAEARAFWNSFSVFGWGAFYSFFLHFALTLTNNRLLNKPSKIVLFYLPALISIILFAPFGYFADIQYELVPSDSGLRDFLSANIGQIWIALYSTIYSVAAVILLVRWWKKIEPRMPLKRHVTYFLISIIVPFFMGSITDVFSDVIGLNQIPRLTIVLLVSPAVLLFTTLRKFGLLLERAKIEFFPQASGTMQEESRLRLFQTAAAMFTIGAAGSFFSEYFIAGRSFTSEFLLALVVWILGIWLLFIPHVAKKHTTQNTLFLITSIVGMTFFIVNEIDTGATTVWAVYIAFLLCSIVLDSKVHTFIFLVITLFIQVVLGILYPEVSATIDNVQYLKRIFIIVLSYFAVRYLTNEYASKLRGYQRFSKEQETLEKISTSFISVHNENAKEKIDKMFEMSAEVLHFDNAYLFEFDAGYENATILNMYVRDIENTSPPFYPGTKFKTADFPEAQSLIAQHSPILCEDVTNVPVDKAGNQKNFFLSRGIHSFFALPIIIDKKTNGFFVIEYKDRSDERFTESRLHFLKIITNILGDTRKKILYEEMLYNFAYFDQSTKLANRNMLKKNLEEMISNRKESEKLVVFDVELDNLRMINDTFGHSIGEQIVIESASILKGLMKDGCSISRVGEEKFVIVMPIAETAEQINACANKIVDAFSDPILPREGIEALFVTVNVGISVYPDDGRDVDTLLRNADLAGYEAKSSHNKIVFCSEQLKSRTEENTLLTNRLFHSLQNEEFSLEFQPQISCSTGKTVGIEALLRWNFDDKKRIPPNTFIPILEQTGLIYHVGLWVLEQALQEHNRLIAKGFPPLRISVNLSVVQFQEEGFICDVRNIIEESRVNPKYIEMEITESLLSKNPEDVLEKIYQLKELGISIAIDDFGRGYSSLHRLKLVPFDRIKIDKDIIDYIDLKGNEAPITEVIILLARAFSADTTAEGVETKEQADFLRNIACDEIQGYYYSKPLSAEALEEFLKKNDMAS